MARNGRILTDYLDTRDVYKDFLAHHDVWAKDTEVNAFKLYNALKDLALSQLPEDALTERDEATQINDTDDTKSKSDNYLSSGRILERLAHEIKILKPKVNGQGKDRLAMLMGIQSSLTTIRDKIHAHNLRLVFTILYKVNNNQRLVISNSDLIHDGSMGLMRAMESFNPDLGFKFSTYAYQWIEAYIRRAVSSYRSLIKVPHYLSIQRVKMHGIIEDYKGVHGEAPSHDYLAKVTDIPRERISEMLEIKDIGESFDSPYSEDNEFSLKDIIGHDDNATDQYIRNDYNRYFLKEAMKTLTERQKTVVSMRYGLDQSGSLTRAVIADHLSLSQERIRQIEVESLKIMKSELSQLDYSDYTE